MDPKITYAFFRLLVQGIFFYIFGEKNDEDLFFGLQKIVLQKIVFFLNANEDDASEFTFLFSTPCPKDDVLW